MAGKVFIPMVAGRLGSVASVARKLAEYQAGVEFPVFGEFVSSMGLTWAEWVKLEKEQSTNRAVRLCVLYKEHLEVEMEKMLRYQNLPRGKYYNYNMLQFLLKKSNPAKYGDKVVSVEVKDKKVSAAIGDFTNDSGVNLLDLESKN